MDNPQPTPFDAAIRQKLREIPAPVGLETRILANVPKPRPPPIWHWLAPALGVAALILVVWLVRGEQSFKSYRREMVRFVSAEYALDLKTESFDETRAGFAKHGYPADYVLPPGLNSLACEGGCLRQWRGHSVALVCTEAKEHDVWLFVVNDEAVPDAPPAAPVFEKTGKITTASWTAGGLIYILATEGDETELESYL